MTRIDAASALTALLKSRPEVGGTGVGEVAASTKRPVERQDQAKVENQTGLQLEPGMLRRIKSIPHDDPERRRKAFRMFMESVLLNQLGKSLLGEPEFDRLVDAVLLQIEQDPELRESSLVAADIFIEQSSRK